MSPVPDTAAVLADFLPRVFWDVRTTTRRIRAFGLLFDRVQSALRGGGSGGSGGNSFIAGGITVREPYRSSRAEYLRAVRESDVWIGVHGASFTQIGLMLDEGVVCEMTVPYHENPAGTGVKGWFRIFSDLQRHEHFVVRLMNGYRHAFLVPPTALTLYIKQASCRWLARHKKQSLVDAAEIATLLRGSGANNSNSNSAAKSASSESLAEWARSAVGANRAALALQLSDIWRECQTLDLKSELQELNPSRQHQLDSAAALLFQLLATLTTKAASADGDALTAMFPITREHSRYLAERLLLLHEADSGDEFRNRQRFQSKLWPVWQVLLDVFAGDGFRVRNIPPPPLNSNRSAVPSTVFSFGSPTGDADTLRRFPGHRWRRFLCLDPRVRPLPLVLRGGKARASSAPGAQPSPASEGEESTQRKFFNWVAGGLGGSRRRDDGSAASSKFMQQIFETEEERAAQDQSCIFWGKAGAF